MPKYEIMLILDPKSEVKDAEKLTKDVFGEGLKSFVKQDNTDLAYEINKSKTGTYILAAVESDPENISEFRRKVNINKSIWRELVVNLDTEKGLNSKPINPKFNKWKKRENAYNRRRQARDDRGAGGNRGPRRFESNRNTATQSRKVETTNSTTKTEVK